MTTNPTEEQSHSERVEVIHAAHSRRYSLYKAVSWRLLGSTDTFLIAWLISGTAAKAGIVALAEFLTKPVLFYLHERIWIRVGYGITSSSQSTESGGTRSVISERRSRSLVKAVSWRIIATIDTMVIAFLVTGSVPASLAIGSLEMLTKTVLYYLHERGWNSFLLRRQNRVLGQADQATTKSSASGLVAIQSRQQGR